MVATGRLWWRQVLRSVQRRSLTWQVGASGLAVTLPLAWWSEPLFRHAPAWAGPALVGGVSALTAAWVAHRAMDAQKRLIRTARQLRSPLQEDDLDIPLLAHDADAFELSAALRRMVLAMRRRRKELEALNQALTVRLQARSHELNTLQDLSMGLAQQTELPQLVDEALRALERTLDYSSASLWAREELSPEGRVLLMGYRTGKDEVANTSSSDLTGMRLSRTNLAHYEQVEQTGEPLVDNDVRYGFWSWLIDRVTDDARTSLLYRRSRSWMALPMQFRDEVLGVLRVDHEEPDYFDEGRKRLLLAVGSQAALAMRHARLAEQSRELAVVEERTRIARDLHDAVSQTMFAAHLVASTLRKTLESEACDDHPVIEGQRTQARQLERLTQGALAEMRQLMLELRPEALERMRLSDLLKQAMDALVGRADIHITSHVASDDDLSPATRMQLYRIAQEALSNVARHSGATDLAVRWVVKGPQQAMLCIHDNGRGFDPSADKPGHFGLGNMRDRARGIGAELILQTALGQGTELCVRIGAPIDED